MAVIKPARTLKTSLIRMFVLGSFVLASAVVVLSFSPNAFANPLTRVDECPFVSGDVSEFKKCIKALCNKRSKKKIKRLRCQKKLAREERKNTIGITSFATSLQLETLVTRLDNSIAKLQADEERKKRLCGPKALKTLFVVENNTQLSVVVSRVLRNLPDGFDITLLSSDEKEVLGTAGPEQITRFRVRRFAGNSSSLTVDPLAANPSLADKNIRGTAFSTPERKGNKKPAFDQCV